jgi:hypothetical protein
MGAPGSEGQEMRGLAQKVIELGADVNALSECGGCIALRRDSG